LKELKELIFKSQILSKEETAMIDILTKIKENYYNFKECRVSLEDLKDLLEFVSLLIWKKYQIELIKAWIDKTDTIIRDRCGYHKDYTAFF
jgi:hypothetical protein